MGVCETRTRKDFQNETIDPCYWEELPHEPKSEHRFRMLSVRPFKAPTDDPIERIGEYAECKHCDSIFAVSEKDSPQ